MKNSIVLLVLVLLIAQANDTLHFVVPDFEPFTYKVDGAFKGIGIERVSAVLDDIDIPYTISLVPNYGRAVEETRRNRSDGFFLATQNSERDSIAQFSNTIFINRWCWFTLEDGALQPTGTDFKESARVATPINTNTHRWLKNEGYNVTFPVSDLSVLVSLLVESRVDAVFISEEVFLQQLRIKKINLETIHTEVQSERPFGIYISNETQEEYPDLLNRINQSIDTFYSSELQ